MDRYWDIGYGNTAIHQFIKVLKETKIKTLVDIRQKPVSRNPGYNQEKLKAHIEFAGIRYIWKGYNLGGWIKDYTMGIQELMHIVNTSEGRVCIMCSERDHLRCHRYQEIQPLMEHKGLTVTHLDSAGSSLMEQISLFTFL